MSGPAFMKRMRQRQDLEYSIRLHNKVQAEHDKKMREHSDLMESCFHQPEHPFGYMGINEKATH